MANNMGSFIQIFEKHPASARISKVFLLHTCDGIKEDISFQYISFENAFCKYLCYEHGIQMNELPESTKACIVTPLFFIGC